MARPVKEGMDYFPHDTNASNDKKIEALRLLYGNDGYAFYFILLEQIYQEPNFEIDVSDAEIKEETFQIYAKKVGVSLEKFNQMFNTALKRGCFDKQLYEEKGLITSNGVKKRAGVVIEKREKMRERYQQNKDKVSDAETTPETTQSKEKESKSKEKESIIIPLPMPDPELQPITEDERAVLNQLKSINSYPYDFTKDLAFIRELSVDYPTVDLLKESKNYATWLMDNPIKKKSNPRLQFRKWCDKANKWGNQPSRAAPAGKIDKSSLVDKFFGTEATNSG